MSSLHPLTPVSHPSPLRNRVSPWLLCAALFAAPTAWFVQLNISVLLGMKRCSGLSDDAASSLVTSGLVAVGLAALLIVLPNGLVKLVNALPFVCGDLRKQSLAQIWANFQRAWQDPRVAKFVDELAANPGTTSSLHQWVYL